MKLLTIARAVGRWGPAGLLEGLLAVLFFVAWFQPFILGASTPATLRFILIAEAGYVLFRALYAAPMEQKASKVEAGFWVIVVAVVLCLFLLPAGGWVGVGLFLLHTLVDFPRLVGAVSESKNVRVTRALIPAGCLAAGLLFVLLRAVPELGWTAWAIPEEYWLVLESKPRAFTQAIPASGTIYFFLMTVVARSRTLSEIRAE